MNAVEAYYAGRQAGLALGYGLSQRIETDHVAPEQRAFREGLADGIFEAHQTKLAARASQRTYLDTIALQDGDKFTSLAKAWADDPL